MQDWRERHYTTSLYIQLSTRTRSGSLDAAVHGDKPSIARAEVARPANSRADISSRSVYSAGTHSSPPHRHTRTHRDTPQHLVLRLRLTSVTVRCLHPQLSSVSAPPVGLHSCLHTDSFFSAHLPPCLLRDPTWTNSRSCHSHNFVPWCGSTQWKRRDQTRRRHFALTHMGGGRQTSSLISTPQ
jgi:hypothetical protein